MIPTPSSYPQAQGIYQILRAAIGHPLSKTHPLYETLEAVEELRDKLWLTRPL